VLAVTVILFAAIDVAVAGRASGGTLPTVAYKCQSDGIIDTVYRNLHPNRVTVSIQVSSACDPFDVDVVVVKRNGSLDQGQRVSIFPGATGTATFQVEGGGGSIRLRSRNTTGTVTSTLDVLSVD
jgi:hypothetical protein